MGKAYDITGGKQIHERDESEEEDVAARDSADLGARAVDDMEGLDADLDGDDNYDDDYEDDDDEMVDNNFDNMDDEDHEQKHDDELPVQQVERDVASRGSMELWDGTGEGAAGRPSPRDQVADLEEVSAKESNQEKDQ